MILISRRIRDKSTSWRIPRGSNPMKSNSSPRILRSVEVIERTMSTPDPPGPPTQNFESNQSLQGCEEVDLG